MINNISIASIGVLKFLGKFAKGWIGMEFRRTRRFIKESQKCHEMIFLVF